MAKITAYKVKELPTKKDIDPFGLYFVKADTDDTFKVFVRDMHNSIWVAYETAEQIASAIDFNLE